MEDENFEILPNYIDAGKATFILIVQNNEKTIDRVMEYLIEDFMVDDELIIVLNNSTDLTEHKIDKYLPKLPNSNTKYIIANFSSEESLEIGKLNSSNNINFIVYGEEYAPKEWIKDD